MKIIAKPIEMISVTDTNGVVKPFRFKVMDKDELLHVVNVISVNKIEETKIAGEKKRIFRCEIQLMDMIKLCEIRYNLDTTLWELYKL